tara:strand:+ start:80 stop:403 length:324 start_codon:yes stop_codon:yes gene_type:complete
MKIKNKLKKSSMATLDFNVLDWGSLGEPIPDSQILWGDHSVSELVDILAPCTLEDIILGDAFPDYISTFEITDKNDAYIRIKQKSRKDKLITDEWINEWRKRNTTNE